MKETTSVAMPSCFHRWCDRFNDVLKTKAQKTGFRDYIGGLLGESQRKNLSQMSNNTVGLSYHKLRHFLVRANWSVDAVNERRLQVMWECRQTKASRSFALIIDDSQEKW